LASIIRQSGLTPVEVPNDRIWTSKDDSRHLSPWIGLPGYRHTVGMARHPIQDDQREISPRTQDRSSSLADLPAMVHPVRNDLETVEFAQELFVKLNRHSISSTAAAAFG